MAERYGQQDSAFTILMASGFLAIPGILLREYKKLGLGDEEMMLLLHLMQFKQLGVTWPTCQELGERMSTKEEIIEEMISCLMRQGFLGLTEVNGEQGLDMTPLYRKLNTFLEPKPKPSAHVASLDLLEKKETGNSIFALFEQEFGRPLSPLEYEKIVRWLDEDRYREELIREALREAVMAAKFNFKYIDRILFEWQKNHIRSMQELQAYREQFRNRMQSRGGGQNAPAARKAREPQQQQPADNGEQGSGDKYDVFYKMYSRE